MSNDNTILVRGSGVNKPTPTFSKPPLINLDQMGRLRVSHLTALLAVSRSTLYAGMASGRYPQPDGKDGKMPYWLTTTIKAFLEAGTARGAS